MAVTAQILINEVRYELKDDATNPNFVDAELLVYLSDAQEDLVQKIGAIWPDYWLRTGETYLDTQNIVSGTANYNLPADLYQIIDVSVEDAAGDTTFIDPIALTRTEDAAADGYRLLNNDLYLYPTPDANVANGLNIYYVEQATRLAAVGNSVLLGEEFRGFYKGWVVLKCKARQEETPVLFVPLYKDLLKQLTAMMVRTNRKGDLSWKIPRPPGAWI